jgi:3-hydroxypropanoate dehydrogenase
MTDLMTLPPKAKKLPKEALNQLFLEARTHNSFQPEPIPARLLKEAYDLAKMGPTAANTTPGRFVFLTTPAAKARLLPALAPGNLEKTKKAPVTVLIASDSEFYEKLPKLLPHVDAKSWYAGNAALVNETAFRNSSLQGAYFILAARAVGLDVGPMSGFDADKINAEFFPDGKWKVNFIANLGYGDGENLFPRNPRLDFSEAALVL